MYVDRVLVNIEFVENRVFKFFVLDKKFIDIFILMGFICKNMFENVEDKRFFKSILFFILVG